MAHGLRLHKKKGFSIYFINYKCIKESPSDATKEGNKNIEKFTFGLPQEKSTYYTVKVHKTGTTKHYCNVSMPVCKFNNK